MACLFRVWNATRTEKSTIISPPVVDLLLKSANKKLNKSCTTLVLEDDGSAVSDDAVLEFLTSGNSRPQEVLLLLEPNEKWEPANSTKIITTRKAIEASTLSELNCSADENEPKLNTGGTPAKLMRLDESNSSTDDTLHNVINEEDGTLTIHPTTVNWDNFKIQWPTAVEPYWDSLQEGIRTKFLITIMVQKIVDQMRHFSVQVKDTGKFNMDIKDPEILLVAKQMVKDYPLIFQDTHDGDVFGVGYATIKRKIKDRIAYLNRLPLTNLQNASKKVPIAHQKALSCAMAGCVNWQPTSYPKGETKQTLREKQKLLKQYMLMTDVDFDVYILLEATYAEQRRFLNNIIQLPSADEIQNQWPILLIPEYLFWHYEKLMGHKITKVTDKMVEYYEKMFAFNELKWKTKTMQTGSKKKKPKRKGRIQVNIGNKENESAIAEVDDTDSSMELLRMEKASDNEVLMCQQVIDIIANHFQDNTQGFFAVCTAAADLTDLAKLGLPSTPYILRVDGSDPIQFYLGLDRVNVWHTEDFLEAFQYFFALTYVCNRKYNDEVAATLQFIGEYMACIKAGAGSKSRCKTITSQLVLTLYNKLRDINVA